MDWKVDSLSKSTGSIFGGDLITLTGSGLAGGGGYDGASDPLFLDRLPLLTTGGPSSSSSSSSSSSPSSSSSSLLLPTSNTTGRVTRDAQFLGFNGILTKTTASPAALSAVTVSVGGAFTFPVWTPTYGDPLAPGEVLAQSAVQGSGVQVRVCLINV